jgi:ABC-type phosphate/phosphonate transport system substrate-binding protein
MAPPLVANARMYAVAPAAAAAWHALFARVAEAAGVPLEVVDHPPPAPLEALWARPDLGCAFMCGFPFARAAEAGRAPRLLAAPVPTRWGAPVYATDLVVAADSPFRTLADTFGHRLAWTVEHSHSGYNAPRHHLLAQRAPGRPRLYAATVGPLVTPRAVVVAVLEGHAEVGPLDGWWHDLLRLHEPETAARLRVVATTDPAPVPPLVASAATPAETAARLRPALLALPPEPVLRLDGFAPADPARYAVTMAWEREALAAGYAELG